MMPPARVTSSSIACRLSPVEMTSSMMRMRLPRMSSASALSMTSFWMCMVVMLRTSTSNTPVI